MEKVRKNRQTLGLAMIMKDEVDDFDRILSDYESFFDKIYVTVTDDKTYKLLSNRFLENSDNPKLELSYFKWVDHFGKARNFNLSHVNTDYWMWIDLDDEILGAGEIKKVVKQMAVNNVDVTSFQYDYALRISTVKPGTISWRERIIRLSSGLTWTNEAIHESIKFNKDTNQDFLPTVVIKHRKTAEQSLISEERNRLILEKEWRKSHRIITAYYLGVYWRDLGNYKKAIEKLSFVVRRTKKRVYLFLASQSLCESYLQIGNYQAALNAAEVCITIDSDHPGPWYQMYAIHKAMGKYDLAMNFAEIAMSKGVDKGLILLTGYDPAWFDYQGPFAIAQTYLFTGKAERAYEIYLQVKKTAPQYVKELSLAAGFDWDSTFKNAYQQKMPS